ncbi:hypothetical protein N0V90_011850 [Kalmusia sp. IMI 367209]|nr:hypothetical protein N0V90_011850 [Kalmusia sp. IMI 367209]
MENFIDTKLHPTDTCTICTEPFSTKHAPVALSCHHIFGYHCIKNWLRYGRGNTNSCPVCRHLIYPSTTGSAFTDASIWNTLCEQTTEHIHVLLTALWHRVQKLWVGKLTGTFTTQELLSKVVIPALNKTGGDLHGVFLDCYELVASTWNSLGQSDQVRGLAVPLVRLVRLMMQTSSILPKWMTTVPRTSMLFWKANAALGTAAQDVNWAHLMEAAQLANVRYIPLLHLYTVLLSQNIVHSEPCPFSKRKENAEALVVERCCKRIGGEWGGRPSAEFKEQVLVVYEELRRHQLEEKRLSLRGHEEERAVVMGLWAMAIWKKEDVGRSRPVAEDPLLSKKSSRG